MDNTNIEILFTLSMFIILIYVIVNKRKFNKENNENLDKKPKKINVELPEIKKTLLYPLCKGTFAFPVGRDHNGLPMASVGIGTPPQLIDLCIDTASCDLIVGMDGCNGCIENEVFYKDESTSYKEMEDICSRITFGTQQDNACWAIDNISFEGLCIDSCEDLKNYEKESEVRLIYEDIKFLGTHKRTKSDYNMPKSNYNVLGLCNSTEEFPLIKQLTMGKFGLALGEKDAYMILGDVPCHNLTPIPMLSHPEFYIAKLVDIQIGNLTINSSPYAVIDTGSNMMFCPSAITNQLIQAVRGEDFPEIILNFGVYKLKISPNQYKEGSNIYIETSSTPQNSIIVGTLMMHNTILEFDTENKSIKIGDL